MSKLFDYLQDEFNLPPPIELELQEIRNIVLEEAGFKWIPISERLPDVEECEVTYNFVNKGLTVFEHGRRRVAMATYKGGEFDVDTIYGSFRASHAGGAINIFAWRQRSKPYDP